MASRLASLSPAGVENIKYACNEILVFYERDFHKDREQQRIQWLFELVMANAFGDDIFEHINKVTE